MIAKVQRGSDAGGLMRYLFTEPGQDGTHKDPRLIASWDSDPAQWDPNLPLAGGSRPDFHAVTEALVEPVRRAERPPRMPFDAAPTERMTIDRPVYHVSVSLARVEPVQGLPADPHLDDAQFAEIVTDLMTRVGLHKEGPAGAHWVAVRHDQAGATHAHIVATLASGSGQRIQPPRNDYYKLGEGCRVWEARLGLRPTAPRDRTGPRYPTRAETEKAQRKQWAQPTRELLRDQVRAVAGVSESVEDFMRRLRDEGLRVHERKAQGKTTGYAVAAARASRTDGRVEEIWFSGGKLDRDLSLPRIRARWAGVRLPPMPAYSPLTVDREAVWAAAVNAAREATATVNAHRLDPVAATATAQAAADFLASSARLVGGVRAEPLWDAARGFARAAHTAVPSEAAPSRAGDGLRQAALLLTLARFVADEDARRLLSLMAQLAVLGDAITRMREGQGRAHQAEAARRAAVMLRPGPVEEAVPAYRHEYTRLREMTL